MTDEHRIGTAAEAHAHAAETQLCEHGNLERGCGLCELEAEVEKLREQLAAALASR